MAPSALPPVNQFQARLKAEGSRGPAETGSAQVGPGAGDVIVASAAGVCGATGETCCATGCGISGAGLLAGKADHRADQRAKHATPDRPLAEPEGAAKEHPEQQSDEPHGVIPPSKVPD